MTPEELVKLWEESSDQDGSSRHEVLCADDYFEGWEVVENDDWSQDHKYQHTSRIIKHTATGRTFSVSASRSGSYHSDWYYMYDDLTEVRAVKETVVVTKWVTVEDRRK